MGVSIYKESDRYFWKITEDDEVIHVSHVGFDSRFDALQNMFINHTMMGIFVSAIASRSLADSYNASNGQRDGVSFINSDGKIRWQIVSGGDVVGKSNDHDDIFEAIDYITIIYTMLSVRVAELAQARSRDIDSE